MNGSEPAGSQAPPGDGWEHFDHGADIGVRGRGGSPARAFEQAALALTAVAVEPAQVSPRERVEFHLAASDLEPLLVDWLNALVYEGATRGMLFGRFEVSIGADGLSATAWGERVDVARHEPAVEVKGATYTMLRVAEESPGRWVAECVVDV